MGEATDDLNTPLGKQAPRPPRRRIPVFQLLTGLFGLCLAVFLGFAIFGDGRGGGQPAVTVAIGDADAPALAPSIDAAAAPPPARTAEPPVVPGQRTVTIIDGSSGERKSITIPAGDADADADPAKAAPAPARDGGGSPAGIDPRLQESSRHGMLPVAAGGAAPVRAYAARHDDALAANAPAVAVVLSGLGISAAQTAAAIRRLPGAVTLGFAPYGAGLGRLTEQARAAGHEILLQVPMEPADYPDNDPGPQTLLTTLAADQNLDRLHWHMSRFAGYVGLMPFMGARLAADDAAMRTVMTDAAQRGLGFFDDGRAVRSVAARLAGGSGQPFARADLVIDAVAAPGEIDAALADLERLARERGTAVGSATIAPVTVERLAAWARTLAERGIALVPLTTAMLKSKSS